ncbi:MAG: DUF4340 domain-containing protein [Planctomycetia bacterium]
MTNSADGAAMRRTAAFLVGGIGLLLLGLAVQPRFRSKQVEPAAERTLFPELADPAKAASMEIVSFDDETATLRPFKVVRSGGVWTLPSHENYPADAKEQLAAACNELVDRPILDVLSTSPGDHEMFGVIEPDPEKIKVGATGVGRLVEFRDAAGNRLARLIIGKQDNRPGPGGVPARNLRYVRKAGQDAVYVVEIDAGKFTTKFDDWIEKDLLKLSPWDVRRIALEDYRLEAVESGRGIAVVQNRRNRIDLAYDDKDAKWSLVKLEGFTAGNKPREEKLGPDEELASGKLNDLRTALGDLKIVDVARKPAGLSADLKADAKFADDPQAIGSMKQRGFLPLESGDILSTDGETIAGLKDGVEYILRFGASTTVAADAEKKDGAEPDEKKKDEKAAVGEGMGRYLLVMARFNESLLEKPVLDPLPEAPEGDEKKDGPRADADKKEGDKEGDAAGKLAAADEAEAKAQAALEERRRVERENRRKQEEYDEKVKAAQKRVKELNARFADWYYVVSNAEYAKIHLDRAGVVQKKPKEDKPADDAKP